jgi:hypothetical protein
MQVTADADLIVDRGRGPEIAARKVYRCKLLQQENGRPLGNRLLCWSKDSLAIQAIVSFVCFVFSWLM